MISWKSELEFERFLRRMRFAGSTVPVGIGDDAAVLNFRGQKVLFTTDMMVEGVHFSRATCPPEWLAHKLLARNVSDIAAMGGKPSGYVVSLAVPSGLQSDFIPRFYRGLRSAQRRMGATLVGGDLSRSPSASLFTSMALTGECDGKPLLRSGARRGDHLWVSGTLGRSAAALELLQSGRVAVDIKARRFRSLGMGNAPVRGELKKMMQAHFLPEPRTRLSRWLVRHGIGRAAIDLSDGLSTDLNRLCAAGKVGAVVHLEDIPISRSVRRWAADPLMAALHGGEDYELLFAAPPAAEPQLRRHHDPVSLHRIGEIVAKNRGVRIESQGRLRPLASGGFDHLRRRLAR